MSAVNQAHPELIALVVLVAGGLAAGLAALGVRRLLAFADRLAARYGSREAALVSPGLARGLAIVAFAGVFAVALVLAVRLLAIEVLDTWLDGVLAYAPRLIAGVLIIALGLLVGKLLRNLVAGGAETDHPHPMLPRLVQAAVIVIAGVTGLQQFGIETSFVVWLALIGVGALLGGLSLAFGLGARDHVANLMAQSELARYMPGERLRIDDDEGVVVDIHATGLTLATAEGRVTIPAARLARGRVVQVAEPESGDTEA